LFSFLSQSLLISNALDVHNCVPLILLLLHDDNQKY
jgi:hypothetical protein